ncbi:hypothetical protein SESBI_19645 [Sesbania bispinosa]|nr:hypothetical protein SESBI_19645 [Sesbania bispinosa]
MAIVISTFVAYLPATLHHHWLLSRILPEAPWSRCCTTIEDESPFLIVLQALL